MKLLKLTLVVLAIGLGTACEKEDPGGSVQTDYLIFGHFYGMCAGETCVETFKLTDTDLSEDTIDDYSAQQMVFVPLPDTKFNQVSDLLGFFPERLRDENTSVFGCPDCADGGGLFIQVREEGVLRTWRIDQVKSNVPAYLHGFIDKVNEKITLINQ